MEYERVARGLTRRVGEDDEEARRELDRDALALALAAEVAAAEVVGTVDEEQEQDEEDDAESGAQTDEGLIEATTSRLVAGHIATDDKTVLERMRDLQSAPTAPSVPSAPVEDEDEDEELAAGAPDWVHVEDDALEEALAVSSSSVAGPSTFTPSIPTHAPMFPPPPPPLTQQSTFALRLPSPPSSMLRLSSLPGYDDDTTVYPADVKASVPDDDLGLVPSAPPVEDNDELHGAAGVPNLPTFEDDD